MINLYNIMCKILNYLNFNIIYYVFKNSGIGKQKNCPKIRRVPFLNRKFLYPLCKSGEFTLFR